MANAAYVLDFLAGWQCIRWRYFVFFLPFLFIRRILRARTPQHSKNECTHRETDPHSVSRLQKKDEDERRTRAFCYIQFTVSKLLVHILWSSACSWFSYWTKRYHSFGDLFYFVNLPQIVWCLFGLLFSGKVWILEYNKIFEKNKKRDWIEAEKERRKKKLL